MQRPNDLDGFAAFYGNVTITARGKENLDRESHMVQVSSASPLIVKLMGSYIMEVYSLGVLFLS
jgi:hypothetical protein